MKESDSRPSFGTQPSILQNLSSEKGAKNLLETLDGIARTAGQEIFRIFRDMGQVTTRLKDDKSPVTNADMLSNALILDALRRLDPSVPVISEETSPPEGSRDACGRGAVWLVDPLDGTKEFLNGIGEFTVNIALVVDGRPVLGVVHIPATGQTFAAAKGHGAHMWDKGGSRRLPVNLPPSKPYRVLTSRYHAPVANADADSFETVPCGSSLKFCRLSEGSAHLYPRFAPTMEWDTAAGHIIVEETGGAVVDRAGLPLAYDKPSLHNPHFLAVSHPSLLKNDGIRDTLPFPET